MTTADCIEIMLLDDLKVSLDVRVVYGRSNYGIGVVAVHSAESNRLTIEKDNVAFDANGANTYTLSDDFMWTFDA